MSTTIKEVLEYLDGRGLILTDDDLLEEALNETGLSFNATVNSHNKEEDFYAPIVSINATDVGIVLEDGLYDLKNFDWGGSKYLEESITSEKIQKVADYVKEFLQAGNSYDTENFWHVYSEGMTLAVYHVFHDWLEDKNK